ncbi:tRNA nucleotidyltransferase/poly(A) polymerase [Gottschalkia purinilytica]|uniref:tRNA nucleotidyltransferase/poly(A) polymerase n=1 Tax=Gottschalkia purinilytica TaxID=1503 RepID=A0A0L0WES4_GOTPU|nr:HD domain-containing protein [Gottschalkia purinilytica]KNF09973.1 tRNA nucleotidyltransferase/poly(A) polymerase [Gottschalkia purinilytica]
MKIVYPEEVKIILDTLKGKGYKGYIVGGCVRDYLLKKIPQDWDICTNATPNEMLNIFKNFKVIPTGIKHGTISVIVNNKIFEVTTFRTEKEYINNRKPSEVEFTRDLKDDLKRRDFTINALAYNDEDGLIDLFCGIEDLEKSLIKCVGDPYERFQEDALRILRGVRFATKLNFNIDNETFDAMHNKRELLKNISKERIREELVKILLSDKPSTGIRMLSELDLLKYTIPDIEECIGFEQKNPNHDKDIFEHTMCVLDNTEPKLNLRLAALLHDIGKPKCFTTDEKGIGHFYGHAKIGEELSEKILRSLKFDNDTILSVKILVEYHMSLYNFEKDKSVKKFINKVGLNNIEDLLKLQIADRKGTKEGRDFNEICEFKNRYEEILNKKEPLSFKDLKINGHDIMELGFSQGKVIGEILKYLLDKVLEDPSLNNKDKLFKLVKEIDIDSLIGKEE